MLPIISRSTGNQTMKYDQSQGHKKQFFPEKSYTKCGGEIIPRQIIF